MRMVIWSRKIEPMSHDHASMARGKLLLLAAAAGLLALVASTSGAPASAASAPTGTPHLPGPTGPHRVGTTSLHLTDTSRPDPWVPSIEARELMISLRYPAASRSDSRERAGTAIHVHGPAGAQARRTGRHAGP